MVTKAIKKAEKSSDEQLNGLGGWLVFYMVSLCITSIFLLTSVVSDFQSFSKVPTTNDQLQYLLRTRVYTRRS